MTAALAIGFLVLFSAWYVIAGAPSDPAEDDQ